MVPVTRVPARRLLSVLGLDGSLASSKTCDGDAVRGHGDVGDADLVEDADGLGVETLLTADTGADRRVHLAGSGDGVLDQLRDDRVDGLERIGLEQVTVEIGRDELGLDVVT